MLYVYDTASEDFAAIDVIYSIYSDNTTIRIPVTILTDMLDEDQEQFSASLVVNDGFNDMLVLGSISSTDVNIMDGDSMWLELTQSSV